MKDFDRDWNQHRQELNSDFAQQLGVMLPEFSTREIIEDDELALECLVGEVFDEDGGFTWIVDGRVEDGKTILTVVPLTTPGDGATDHHGDLLDGQDLAHVRYAQWDAPLQNGVTSVTLEYQGVCCDDHGVMSLGVSAITHKVTDAVSAQTFYHGTTEALRTVFFTTDTWQRTGLQTDAGVLESINWADGVATCETDAPKQVVIEHAAREEMKADYLQAQIAAN